MLVGGASETGPGRQNGFAPFICSTTNLAAAEETVLIGFSRALIGLGFPKEFQQVIEL